MRNDSTEVKVPDLPEVATQYHQFVDCCLAGEPARSDFGWATYMREEVITGEIAERRVNTLLHWDAKARR